MKKGHGPGSRVMDHYSGRCTVDQWPQPAERLVGGGLAGCSEARDLTVMALGERGDRDGAHHG
jgi:hypothetical protein